MRKILFGKTLSVLISPSPVGPPKAAAKRTGWGGGFLLLLFSFTLSAQTPSTPAPTYRILSENDRPPAAHPADGIALIEAPTSSPMGGANLDYPIKLPPARKQHAPDLSIGYSSDHLHGWLGRGWDLSLPTIDVETRWGVPRFDATTETETYLLEGSMLAPVAHRGESRPRAANVTFSPRVESDFQRITRHGNSPKNYWWEIQYPDGIVEYYGGNPDGLIPTAHIRDAAGNIASWALVRSTDVHGNRIDYHYLTQADKGRESSPEIGTNRYPDHITFNGFGNEAGPCQIRFVRDRQLGEARRPDVRADYAGGYKMVTADLLRRIEISYRGEMIRHYELGYETGAFRQSLLSSITEFGSDGSELASHAFDYYDETDGAFSAFGPTETWNAGRDNVEGDILNPIPGFTGEISALGGSKSTSQQVGAVATVGPIGPLASKEFTVGGSFGSGSSEANGMLSFVDINGDLLPDKLFRRGSELVWRKNLFGEGSPTFGPVRPVNGIADFSIVSTSETNFGFEANITPFFAGYENTTARTSTTTYFSDFNGDDLVDILHKGKIYFNHLNGNGDPTFTLSSGDTPSPIISGAAPDGDLVTVDPAEQQALIDATPLHDVVRSWEAPFTGTVRISGDIRLVAQSGIDEYEREDGLRVSIETPQSFISGQRLYEANIPANDYAPRTPTGVNAINVLAGQRIYFRVHSIFDGAFDQVAWDPEITYVGQDPTETDVNGLPLYRYRAGEDFLLASCQTVAMPIAGRVDLTGTFTKPALRDSLHLELLRNGQVLFTHTYAPDSVVTDQPIEFRNFPVGQDNQIQLRMRSYASVDWTAPKWTPLLTYVSADDGTSVINDEGEPVYSYCPAIDFTMRTKLLQQPRVWRPAADSFRYTYNLNYGFNGMLAVDFQDFSLAVRGRDTTYLQRDTLLALGGAIAGAVDWAGGFAVEPGDSVWIEVFGPAALEAELNSSVFSLSRNGNNVPVTLGVHRKRTSDEMIFGPQFRGWGQFVYRGADGAGALPIQDLLLRLPDPDINEEDIEDIEIDPDNPDFSDFEDLADDPTREQFIVMVADPKEASWRGYDDLTLVGRDYLSSSRLGEDDVILTPDLGTGGSAPPLTSIAKIEAVAAGAGFGPASLAGSIAENTTTNLLEVMDLNGDRYPDLVTPTRAQYTTVYGGLSDRSTTHGFGNHVAHSRAVGGTAGGKFVDSSPTNSGDGSGKGSRKRFRKAKAVSKNQGAKAQSANESAEAGGSISLSFSVDNDYTEHSWLDVNGDGLTDKVWDNGDVAFNYGYRFGARENWGFADIRRGQSQDFGAGGGINISNNSFAAGFAITRTDNYSSAALQDVNGDGLADALSYDPDTRMLRVALNHGSGFSNYIDWARLDQNFDKGDATAESLNFAFTVCIPIFFIRLCVNPSGSAGRGVSRVLSQFNDIDGDGFLDEIHSTTDNELKVRRSTIGKTNLLREVRRPLGATIEMDYVAAGNDYGLPFPKWLLAESRLNDGVDGDGPRWRKTRHHYESPAHDRHEREFLGFGKTIDEELDTENGDAPYRKTVIEYSNANYYNRGLPQRQYTEDADGNRYRETVFTYLITNPETQTELPPNLLASDQGRALPLLMERTENFYEGGPTVALSRRTAFLYDSLGNVLSRIEYGDGTPEDELRTDYVYHPFDATYLAGQPQSIKIYGGGELLRHSETDIDGRGNVMQLRKFLAENTVAVHDFTYDEWSNVLAASRPANEAGERMTYTYTIDSVEHLFAIRTEDSYGYSSTAEYEFSYGQMLMETDINGHSMKYKLDAHGRVEEIKLPKDSVYSFRYHYFEEATPPYAMTERFDPLTESAVPSYTVLDGLGRVIQQQHLEVIDNAERLVVTGEVGYDSFDRPVTEGYPRARNTAVFGFSTAPASAPKATSSFDVLDRVTTLRMPDNSGSTMEYGFATDPAGQLRFQEKMTDALGFSETTLMDERGRRQAFIREADTTSITTLFTYNTLSELLSVTDAGGFVSSYEYDRLGRRIASTPADGGRTDLVYDLSDNLVRKQTPNLREILGNDGFIEYAYDHERLRRITYPINFQNKTEFSYGAPDARFNRAGRIVLRQDASGGEEYFYDEHGMLRKTIRTMLINESTARTFVSEIIYDSWGRETAMAYPDGEWVNYGYNAAGKLSSMWGEKDGNTYDYLKHIQYDAFGRMVGKTLGNDSEETITFDPLTQRPARLSVRTDGSPLQDLSLTYDVVGNLETSEQSVASIEGLGGSHRQQFAYDPLHRLTEATGSYQLADGEESFSYFIDHDDLYNQSRRELARQKNGEPDLLNSFDQRLSPDPAFPHRIQELGGRAYDYDANGNLLGYQGEAGSYRYQQARWDEENRMMEFSDNGTISRYTYSADGERAIQSQGAMKGVFTDGAPAGFISHSGNYVAYVSPFFTFTESSFTKHYFIGDQRIMTKEGTGEFNNTYWYAGGLTAGDLNYTARMDDLTRTVWNYYVALGLPPGPPTLPGYYGQPGVTGDPLPTSEGGIFGSQPGFGVPGPGGPPDTAGPPGPPTWYASPPERDSIGAGYGYEGYGVFPEVVASYYHGDQLGNVCWITDQRGKPAAYRAYLPSGEVLTRQTLKAPPLDYNFNGKEEDSASGLNYFGARYLEPETGRWLSMDPLADEFPGHNPYAFGLHNPLRFTDPDGREAFDMFSSPLAAAIDFSRIYNERSIFHNYEFGTLIYKQRLNGQDVYFYDDPVTDLDDSGVSLPEPKRFGKVVADIHTHSRMEPNSDGYLEHSDTDLDGNDRDRRPGYVANPKGQIRKYDPRTGEISIVATGLPHDELFYGPEDPSTSKDRHWRRMNHRSVSGRTGTSHTRRQNRRNGRRYAGPPLAGGRTGIDPRKRWGWHAALKRRPVRHAQRR
ncbi:SpvB/TcaC N-terminal domain-containing protein [Neolewinella agarilytica]|uniref:SpvB/TcaC N-terminal domain-containing protein n=1 Tax=Neolewinella agarilytica TaxID=478744 RepID=UPI002352BCE2|nr:SpvB/TcaC N-terminal domain-containing protein [Neolewinella agarilytica]